jgi:hypothetical protein
VSSLSKCPRCRTHAFENLKDYSHCVECLYVEDRWKTTEAEVLKAIGIEKAFNERAGDCKTLKKLEQAS